MHVYPYDSFAYLVGELFPLAATAWTGYLCWRLVRAYERRGAASDRLESLTDRVRLLEDDVEQTVEAQRFTTRLLLGRSAGDESEGRAMLSSRGSAADGGASAGLG